MALLMIIILQAREGGCRRRMMSDLKKQRDVRPRLEAERDPIQWSDWAGWIREECSNSYDVASQGIRPLPRDCGYGRGGETV